MAQPLVDLIITSHSNKEQLVRCLESIYRQSFDRPMQITVVDNASSDNSMLVVTSRYPQVKVIVSQTNQGIGAALNLGLASTSAPFVAMFHQDVELGEGWLDRMIDGIETSDPRVGSVCSLVTVRTSTGSKQEVDSAGIGFRNGQPRRLGEGTRKDSIRLLETQTVFGVPSCAAMYKRAMLERIKLGDEIIDEDLFETHEDFDLALRAYLHGYSSMFLSDVWVLHKRGILRQHDVEAQIQRQVWETINPYLVLIKCLPPKLLRPYGLYYRKTLALDIARLVRRHNVGVAIGAWRRYRKVRRKMIKKRGLLLETVRVNEKALEKEVFGRS